MATPVRYPSGVSTYPPRSTMNTFPTVPSAAGGQSNYIEHFTPYQSGRYTVTQTNGTAAQAVWNSNILKLSTVGTTAADQVFAAMTAQGYQFIPGNKLWVECIVALPALTSDVNVYMGLFDNVNPTAATNAVYWRKPSGGTATGFYINKAATLTSFTGAGDVSKPNGIAGDPVAAAGTLAGTVAGGLHTAISVATPGALYQQAPLVLVTTAAGSGALAYCQLGSSVGGTSPGGIGPGTGATGGGLYMPIITAPGSAYTNGAASFEVDAWIAFQIYYDGVRNLYAGISGRPLVSISPQGVTGIAAGSTNAVPTGGASYAATGTQIGAGIMPIQPAAGDPYNILPQVPMYFVVGYGNTTAAARSMYVQQYSLGDESN